MTTRRSRSDEAKQRIHLLQRPSSFYFVISIIFLSTYFSFACQTQTQKSAENTPAAKPETSKAEAPKTETTLNWPPKVTQIDEQALKDLLKPKGKPLLINFWATWCGPCREEFPDLVKIGKDHRSKIDLVTISLDELSEIGGEVPQFLTQMNADFPAYLLKTKNEDAAIALVSKDWKGALPFTILFNAQGEPVYSKQGKFSQDALLAEIAKF
jgi:thiol-disulfide isomerase/thioredoxin